MHYAFRLAISGEIGCPFPAGIILNGLNEISASTKGWIHTLPLPSHNSLRINFIDNFPSESDQIFEGEARIFRIWIAFCRTAEYFLIPARFLENCSVSPRICEKFYDYPVFFSRSARFFELWRKLRGSSVI